jgi:hypothetical protein
MRSVDPGSYLLSGSSAPLRQESLMLCGDCRHAMSARQCAMCQIAGSVRALRLMELRVKELGSRSRWLPRERGLSGVLGNAAEHLTRTRTEP